MINQKYNVFIHIPKTAGTSLRSMLDFFSVEYLDLGHSVKQIDHYYKDANAFSFCFVREPQVRLKSAFFHLVDTKSDPDFDGESLSSFNKNRLQLSNEYGEDYRQFLLDKGYQKYNFAHFAPQTTWSHRGERCASFIGRFENLNDDIVELGKMLGVSVWTLPRKKITVARNYSTNFIIDNQLTAEVKKFYHQDYKLLGY